MTSEYTPPFDHGHADGFDRIETVRPVATDHAPLVPSVPEYGYRYDEPREDARVSLRGRSLGLFKVMIGDERVSVDIRHHARANKINIRYLQKTEEFVATVPDGVPREAAERFIKRNLNWIESRRAKSHPPIPFADGESLPFLGHTVVIKNTSSTNVSHKHNDIEISYDEGMREAMAVPEADGVLLVAGPAKAVPRKVRTFLANACRDKIHARLTHLSARTSAIKTLKLRDTIGHWAALSDKGIMSASWRLIMAPDAVIDYVLTEAITQTDPSLLNHAVADTLYKDEATLKEWLKTEGPLLHRYGASRAKNHRDPTLSE